VRPAWDIILIGLMLGGIAVSATGVYLRRVRNDIVVLFRVIAMRGAAQSRGLPGYVMHPTGRKEG
jgi:hypothetical protein